jgi:hypothetical protein
VALAQLAQQLETEFVVVPAFLYQPVPDLLLVLQNLLLEHSQFTSLIDPDLISLLPDRRSNNIPPFLQPLYNKSPCTFLRRIGIPLQFEQAGLADSHEGAARFGVGRVGGRRGHLIFEGQQGLAEDGAFMGQLAQMADLPSHPPSKFDLALDHDVEVLAGHPLLDDPGVNLKLVGLEVVEHGGFDVGAQLLALEEVPLVEGQPALHVLADLPLEQQRVGRLVYYQHRAERAGYNLRSPPAVEQQAHLAEILSLF